MSADPQRGLWLLPTRGRVHDKLPRFLAAFIASGATTPGLLLVGVHDFSANRAAYDALTLPVGWTIRCFNMDATAPKCQLALDGLLEKPETEWVGWLSDDGIPETPNWDTRLIAQLNGWNVISTDDAWQAPKRFNGALCWSADLLRTVGYMFPPGVQHFYMDDVWETLGQMTGCWTCDMSVMVRHRHVEKEMSHDATSEKIKTFWSDDERAFGAWRRAGKIIAANKIMELMQQKGRADIGDAPDLKGVRLAVCTPCGSGQYESVYVKSLINTLNIVRQFGGEVAHWEALYISDINLARAKSFGMFLRSDYTHMLFVDDDMGWRAEDVVRLLLAKKDFVAVAGPVKTTPMNFAVNVSDDHGRPIPHRLDEDTGYFIAAGVGMAFTLITHHCAERMAQHYADLEFVAIDGRQEFAVFNSLVVNKRYLSEDYAFCHRWRQIGGEVLICPDISLQHVGSKIWEGDWLTDLEQKTQQARTTMRIAAE